MSSSTSQDQYTYPPRALWPLEDQQEELSASTKLWQKCKDEPFVPIGASLTLGTLVYGAYAYRFRGPMTTSRYLMRLRVLSQGAIVMAMAIGAAFTTRKMK